MLEKGDESHLTNARFVGLLFAMQKPLQFKILMDEYADDVNRACGDVHGLTFRVYGCANVFECNPLHVHGVHHRERVHVRELSFHEHGRVHVLHSLKIAFQQP